MGQKRFCPKSEGKSMDIYQSETFFGQVQQKSAPFQTNNNNNNNNNNNSHIGHCTHTSESANKEIHWSQRRN